MMYKTLILLFFIPLLNFAQVDTVVFNSEELGQERTLKIYVPESFKKDKSKIYPLTILLDGDYLFDIYVANSKLFAKLDKAPEQIIVGIIQQNTRNEDCSYSKINDLPDKDGAKFYRFIRGELINYLEDRYNISPFKTVFGMGLTANFINYFLIEDQPIFNAFVNINPNFSKSIVNLASQKIPTLAKTTYYYLNSGNYYSSLKQKKLKLVNDKLTALKSDNFNFKYDYFKNETKTAALGMAIPSAISFIFKMYAPISKDEYDNLISKMSPPDAIAYLEKKYVEIEYLYGVDLKIREKDIFAIEPIIIDKQHGDYLGEFGKMILKLYPQSPIGNYYIGQYYETGKDYKRALKQYKIGYSKISLDSPNSEAFYQNIERVLLKRQERKNKN